jgi:hypothetical protein
MRLAQNSALIQRASGDIPLMYLGSAKAVPQMQQNERGL